jgi:serine/threonine protein kinase
VLAKLHDARFVHRDFKPGNIFIGRGGELVLGDAGLAFYKDDSARATQTYENVGTRDYMPAWAYSRRLKEINPTFDVFSVGKVIWAMIAGEPACPLWYVLKLENDLTTRFPERVEILWINEFLTKFVVEDETAMQIRDGSDLLKAIDLILPAIQSRAVPPAKALDTRSCRVCFIGNYVEDNSGHRGGIVYPAGHCFAAIDAGILSSL